MTLMTETALMAGTALMSEATKRPVSIAATTGALMMEGASGKKRAAGGCLRRMTRFRLDSPSERSSRVTGRCQLGEKMTVMPVPACMHTRGVNIDGSYKTGMHAPACMRICGNVDGS